MMTGHDIATARTVASTAGEPAGSGTDEYLESFGRRATRALDPPYRRRAARKRTQRIPRTVRPHRRQHCEMSAARLTCNADLVGPDLEVARMRLDPADRVVDVDQRGRVSIGRMAEIQ